MIDPFAGKLNEGRASMWMEQPLYDSTKLLINNGLCHYIPQLDTLREGYETSDTFYMKRDSIVCVWASMHGMHNGDVVRVEWYSPRHLLWDAHNNTWNAGNFWANYSSGYIKLPPYAGKWRVKYFINEHFYFEHEFLIIKLDH